MTISKKFIAGVFLAKGALAATMLLDAPSLVILAVYVVVALGSIIIRRKIEKTEAKGWIARGYRDAKATLCGSILFFSIGAIVAYQAAGMTLMYLMAALVGVMYLVTVNMARKEIKFGKEMAEHFDEDNE